MDLDQQFTPLSHPMVAEEFEAQCCSYCGLAKRVLSQCTDDPGHVAPLAVYRSSDRVLEIRCSHCDGLMFEVKVARGHSRTLRHLKRPAKPGRN